MRAKSLILELSCSYYAFGYCGSSRKELKAIWWRKNDFSVFEIEEKKGYSVTSSSSTIQVLVGDLVDTPELPIFSFNSVASATGDFAEENKLGLGGFGTGNFSGGREIAVKSLSGKSKQGLEEFKNEILLIAKLQHRNLVRLLGCCIENNQKMLLYEYVHAKQELGQFPFWYVFL
ncbi:hypothetical protein F2Q69_00031508 [Brassica cretica]|uniref:Protein kinase domain-containing protein n=1 Tax=Brassica cretica TaxID=69181 RepID=A0A8S9RWG1_BRACR|nr:hypothetical protein F2Q69_00031508 [Brassica cretica]